jgi:leucyl aminopeptidase (aminopeptidase T)
MAKKVAKKIVKKSIKKVLTKVTTKKKTIAKPKTSRALDNAALIAVRDCMGVKEGESVLVITDVNKRNIGYAIWEAAKNLSTEAMLLEIKPRSTNGEEPPSSIAELMGNVNVCLCPTTKSLTHTNARRNASAKGARISTLPGITEDMMTRCLNADYNRIAELSNKLKEILDPAKIIRVTSKNGTDITMPKEGRVAKADTGIVHNPGEMSNLPAGETFLAPLEGQSNGVVVVDGSMAGVGILKNTKIKIIVKDGYATEVTGGKEAEALVKLFEPHGLPARNVAEFGIGTNYKAKLTGEILEDEKVMGTIHIAFGDNMSMGGVVNVPSHLDGLVKNPTVEVDGQIIMKDGKFLI